MSKIVCDGLADFLKTSKYEFTTVGEDACDPYVDFDVEELKKLIYEYFGTGHGNPQV
jgi:hypothetical protein